MKYLIYFCYLTNFRNIQIVNQYKICVKGKLHSKINKKYLTFTPLNI